MAVNQRQSSGDNSVVVQAGGNVNLHGPSYGEVRQIALDLLRANFIEVQGIAKKTVDARFNELVDIFLKKMSTAGVDLSVMQDPDMQYSFAIAGREYARSGDEEQKRILLELLLNKSSAKARSLKSIVFGEAISTVGRLTSSQITALAANYSVHHLAEGSIATHEELTKALRLGILPFKEGFLIDEIDARHLAYAGCIQNTYFIPRFGLIFQDKFPRLFQSGIDESEMPQDWNAFKNEVFAPSPIGDGRFWLKADSVDAAKGLANKIGRPDLAERFARFIQFNQWGSDDHFYDAILVSLVPEFADVIESWETSSFRSMQATSVGSTIGRTYWELELGID
ncbi:LPO_1073/Vpar_1526 family protein [Actinomadura geliboluensis]|uniref:LPO_1073/Vpar_1526 family protein n=1 Tax=Actinomadura geliboluensis TaxID=882440 RepID=UPI0036994EF1